MYCSHCGKELSDGAFMCPGCGEPTKNAAEGKETDKKSEVKVGGLNKTAFSAVGLVLSTLAFVTGIVFGALSLCYVGSIILLYIISASTVLPALTGLSFGIYTLIAKENSNNTSKACAICSVVFSGIVILFLFIIACIVVAGAF